LTPLKQSDLLNDDRSDHARTPQVQFMREDFGADRSIPNSFAIVVGAEVRQQRVLAMAVLPKTPSVWSRRGGADDSTCN